MNEKEFLRHYIANAAQLMWFLGAGTSRTAGIPTATDITWDLKLKYYCVEENEDIQKHDINNDKIKSKIQSFMDSRGYPQLWSYEEYSFYFDLMFSKDRAAQQRYVTEQLSSEKVSLNIGHRCMAALIELGLAKVIFTTNFDDVIEQAVADVSKKGLMAYHLEGSYAAIEALNSEQFPIYAKIHGDFRYQSIKNISEDLVSNDQKIKDCFLAAATRYGLVISGYSGRDQNVMTMLYEAIEQRNAFPRGLFWTVTNRTSIAPPVMQFLESARTKGINAHLLEVGTFDTMLSKMWRQVDNKPLQLDNRVRTAAAHEVRIPLPGSGTNYPLLRTNALPIVEFPKVCAVVDIEQQLSYAELGQLIKEGRHDAVITKTDIVLGWGAEENIRRIFSSMTIRRVSQFVVDDPIQALSDDLRLRSFYERALVNAVADRKPVRKRQDNRYFLIVDYKKATDPAFLKLKTALSEDGRAAICGTVPGTHDIFWSEAVSVKLEEKNGSFWVMLRPEIWIEPKLSRKHHIDFIRSKRLRRYNRTTNELLNAWITLLLGGVGNQEPVEVSCYGHTSYPAKFLINTRTSYSRKAR